MAGADRDPGLDPLQGHGRERDPRLSTVRKIVAVLEPERDRFIAIIAARFLLDNLEIRETEVKREEIPDTGIFRQLLEECIIAAARAEKDGASGIVCAPILASIVEKIVDIPVAMLRPELSVVSEAITTVAKKIG